MNILDKNTLSRRQFLIGAGFAGLLRQWPASPP